MKTRTAQPLGCWCWCWLLVLVPYDCPRMLHYTPSRLMEVVWKEAQRLHKGTIPMVPGALALNNKYHHTLKTSLSCFFLKAASSQAPLPDGPRCRYMLCPAPSPYGQQSPAPAVFNSLGSWRNLDVPTKEESQSHVTSEGLLTWYLFAQFLAELVLHWIQS